MTQPRAVKRFTTGTDSSPGRKLEDGVSGPHFVEELHEAVVDRLLGHAHVNSVDGNLFRVGEDRGAEAQL